MSENQPGRAQNSFRIASHKFSNESSVRESRLWNHDPSLPLRENGRGRLSGRSLTTEGDGDEFSDRSTTGESESGVEDSGESVANLSDEDEILEDLTKPANLPEIMSSVPSTVNSPKDLHENDHNEWKAQKEDNFNTSSTSDKDTRENLVPTITDPEVGNLSARLAQMQKDKVDPAAVYVKSKGTSVCATDTVKQKRQVDQPHSAFVDARDSYEIELPVSGIRKEFNIASEKPIKVLEELKMNDLSVVEVLKSMAALRRGLELMSRPEIKVERIWKAIPKPPPHNSDESAGEAKKVAFRRLRLWREAACGMKKMLDEKFESRGAMEADDLLDEAERQAMKRLLPDSERERDRTDPAKDQYNQSRLIDLQIIGNAEAAPGRADRARVHCYRQALEADERSEEGDADEDEVNDTARVKGGREEAEHRPEGKDGKVSPQEAQVTIVNNASSNIPIDPSSRPWLSPLQFHFPRTQTIERGSASARPLPERWRAAEPSAQPMACSRLHFEPRVTGSAGFSSCEARIQERNDKHQVLKLSKTLMERPHRSDTGGEEGDDGEERATRLVPTERPMGVNIDQPDDVFSGFRDGAAGPVPLQQNIMGNREIRFFTMIKIVDNEGRKDKSLQKAIINKKECEASPAAFRCEWEQQYEGRLCIPIGSTLTRETTFQDSTVQRAMVTQRTGNTRIFAPFHGTQPKCIWFYAGISSSQLCHIKKIECDAPQAVHDGSEAPGITFRAKRLRPPNRNFKNFANLDSMWWAPRHSSCRQHLLNLIRLSIIQHCMLSSSPLPETTSARTSPENLGPQLEVQETDKLHELRFLERGCGGRIPAEVLPSVLSPEPVAVAHARPHPMITGNKRGDIDSTIKLQEEPAGPTD
ncbi:hypothetical protein HOY80DRAFT_1134920 [Tuber brumale]|nr:hypothetical protein HOY80DRAFT_1134920 [Tuber brumale]